MKIFMCMGSDSDWSVMKTGFELLKEFEVDCEVRVVSAHRTPEDLEPFAKECEESNGVCIIAGAGGAAHLPGMLASYTSLPVIGVPVKGSSLDGMDSLLSIVQMPKGVPVATVGVNNSINASLLALRILGSTDLKVREKLRSFREKNKEESRLKTKNLIL